MQRSPTIQHIEITENVCGGRPRIVGSRIRVQDVVIWIEVNGESPDEIVAQYPQLSLADVHAALAYYFDHRDEINADIAESQRRYDSFKSGSNASAASLE